MRVHHTCADRAHAMHGEVGAKRDPAFIRANLAALSFFVERYHRTTIDGFENVPSAPALAVGNHNGGVMSPDMFALMVGWWRRFGIDEPAYGLAHDLPLRIPIVGTALARCGAVPAHPANAATLLRGGAKVLVYPGGDIDAFRPWSRRHEIVFGKRRGFVRVALRAGVPILPVVSIGAHEAFHVVNDGTAFVRRFGLKRFTRVEVLPLILGLPWGVWVGPQAYLPIPVNIRIRILPPIQWPSLSPDAADDDEIVWRCREEVRERMQACLADLVREGGFGRRRDFFGGSTE